MAKVTPQQWLQKWGTNLNASGQYIKDGVARVKTAPGQAAAAAQDRMLAGITQAVTSGMWAKRVSSVSLQDWQAAITNKGIPRIAQGVTQAQQTKSGQITTLLANVDAAAAAAHALPKGNLQQSIARATAFMTEMSTRSAASKSGG